MRKPVGPDSFYEMSRQKFFDIKVHVKGTSCGPVVKTLLCSEAKEQLHNMFIYTCKIFLLYIKYNAEKKYNTLRNTLWLDLKFSWVFFISSVYLVLSDPGGK